MDFYQVKCNLKQASQPLLYQLILDEQGQYDKVEQQQAWYQVINLFHGHHLNLCDVSTLVIMLGIHLHTHIICLLTLCVYLYLLHAINVWLLLQVSLEYQIKIIVCILLVIQPLKFILWTNLSPSQPWYNSHLLCCWTSNFFSWSIGFLTIIFPKQHFAFSTLS